MQRALNLAYVQLILANIAWIKHQAWVQYKFGALELLSAFGVNTFPTLAH
jgi:hypothetical protein